MASAKGGGTTRRSSSDRSSKKSQEPEVSPARWAGVALVIAAIVGAVFLAMISPSDSDAPSQPGNQVAEVQSTGLEPSPSASASATAIDVPVPEVAPEIVIPTDGKVTGEYEFEVTVAVPDDTNVARKHLDLHVYNGGQLAKTAEKPKPGTNVKVKGIRLAPGQNSLTAVLSSPAGPGPASEPIGVILDEDIPPLEIVAPKDKHETYEDSVVVEVTSEVDASVTIHNLANDHDPEVTIGPSGSASEVIQLKRGKNRIRATSVDQAGQRQKKEVVVTRLDGRPSIKLRVPETVDPPDEIRIVAEVTDARKKPMQDAEVHFTLTAPNQSTLDQNSITNAKGRAVWEVAISGSSSPADALEVGVTVFAPSGDKRTKTQSIALE
jgi:hypothetical protein